MSMKAAPWLALALVVFACVPVLGRASAIDPGRSVVPPWIHVVGRVQGGVATDTLGAGTIEVWDFANPKGFASVMIDFSECCDVRLCGAIVNGQTLDCENRRITGIADFAGRFRFTVLGAATDPGTACDACLAPGAGLGAVRVFASIGSGWVPLRPSTAVCLDQDGGASPVGDGATVGDVANLLRQVGASALLGGAYRARGDLNRDGALSVADVGVLFGHVGRLALESGAGCAAAFCSAPLCP